MHAPAPACVCSSLCIGSTALLSNRILEPLKTVKDELLQLQDLLQQLPHVLSVVLLMDLVQDRTSLNEQRADLLARSAPPVRRS